MTTELVETTLKTLTQEQIQDAKSIAARFNALHHDAIAIREATGGAILGVYRYSSEHETTILVSTVAAFIACAPDTVWQFEQRNSDLYPFAATARICDACKVELLLDLEKVPALVALWEELTR